MSCNGCRVLRRGCVEGCILRSCLQWINNPAAESNATLFLAKFYGRAGLMNLLTAANPDNRQQVFQSLLYEACGRIINPVNGAVGLMSSGNWRWIDMALNAALHGGSLMMVPQEEGQINFVPFSGCNIRRFTKFSSPLPINRIRPTRNHEPLYVAAEEHMEMGSPNLLMNVPDSRSMLMGWNSGGEGGQNLGGGDRERMIMMRRAPSQESFSAVDVHQSVGMNPGTSRVGLDLTLGRTVAQDLVPAGGMNSGPSGVDLDLTLGLNYEVDYSGSNI